MTYKITEKFSRKEQFGLISQMRRAAISIAANIIEGQNRQTRKEFTQFLYIAKGSLVELEYYFELSLDLNYINREAFNKISKQRILVGKLLSGFLRKIKS